MKILFLSPWFPYPPDNGSKIRIYNLLKGLASENAVTLISFFDPTNPTPDFTPLENICQEIIQIPHKLYNPRSLQSRLGLFLPNPRSVLDTFSKDAANCIQTIAHADQFEIAIASQIGMAGYRKYFQHIPAIFEEVELGVPYHRIVGAASFRSRARARLTWLKHKRYVEKLLTEYQACTVVSSQEKQLLKTSMPKMENVTVIPNCIDLSEYEGYRKQAPARNSLIYTGSFRYQANYEAMVWFLGEVFPLVREQVPDATLTITGDHCDLPLPTTDHVKLAGYVDDIRPLVANSWVSLAPLWTGGGTRLKIIEAMALGTPVVATSKGAEGLDVQAGHDLLIADRPKDFAQSVIRLLLEPETREKLSVNGYKLVSSKYDWPIVMPEFLKLIDQVLARPLPLE
jgi:polysaccharide biosynthesis protein PslH